MLRYLVDEKYTIKDKDGKFIQVKRQRERKKYSDNYTYTKIIDSQVVDRLDQLAISLYGSMFKLSGIIDVNDIDVFSFKTGDKINYVDGNLII